MVENLGGKFKLAKLFLRINTELTYFIENYKKVIGLGVEDKFAKNLKLSYEEFILQRKKIQNLYLCIT